uniref:Putative restriction alleviation protein n=1 Tax=viral metagenome TaxID=1070528 RepID=A0A6M3LT12_9ZZZZ
MKKEVIKPCPFCGSLRVSLCRTNSNACWIRCDKCGADAPSNPFRKKAITIWNRRPKTNGVAIITLDDEKEKR